MNIKQLREWLLQNGGEDKWWLHVDGVTEELPASLETVEEFLLSDYHSIKIMHSSCSNVEGGSWITVQKAAPIAKLSFSDKEIKTSQENSVSRPEQNEVIIQPNLNAFGLIAAAFPLVTAFYLFGKISNMSLIQGPLSEMVTINYAATLIMAILVGIDAARLGVGLNKSKGVCEPATWGVLVMFFSLIALPWYLYHRKKYGAKSYFLLGLVSCLLWIATGLFLLYSVSVALGEHSKF